MDRERFDSQIRFIVEIDKLKQVYRQTYLIDGTRSENDVEHSWHLSLMAMLLSEYVQVKSLDICKVIKMVLIHDIVEIDAGDTFCYDDAAVLDKEERELKAADRLFNILPSDQAKELRSLWDEFEEKQTPEAKFASSLDRLQPLIHSYFNKGTEWKKRDILREKVIIRNQQIRESSEALWEYAKEIIDESVKRGYLREK